MKHAVVVLTKYTHPRACEMWPNPIPSSHHAVYWLFHQSLTRSASSPGPISPDPDPAAPFEGGLPGLSVAAWLSSTSGGGGLAELRFVRPFLRKAASPCVSAPGSPFDVRFRGLSPLAGSRGVTPLPPRRLPFASPLASALSPLLLRRGSPSGRLALPRARLPPSGPAVDSTDGSVDSGCGSGSGIGSAASAVGSAAAFT